MAEPEVQAESLSQRQAAVAEEYQALVAEQPADGKGKRRLAKLSRQFDEIYWKRVEELLVDRVEPDRDDLAFSDEERLLVDAGLLDESLVAGAGPELAERLLEEIRAPGPPNHFYLSEWLEDRYRRFRLDQEVRLSAEEGKEQSVPAASRQAEARAAIFKRLGPLFQGLPGVSSQISRFMVSGGLDEQILRSNIAILDRPARGLFMQRGRLVNLRAQVLAKARVRARDQATLKLFDLVDDVYAADWRERFGAHQQGKTQVAAEEEVDLERSLSKEKAVEYLVSELRFAKTLMPLGALAGGVTRTCAVYLQEGPRVTKRDTEQCLALTRACDRDYTLNPVVLIAPFRGRGIFEWDRDSLVVSLVPAQSPEDSVANAAGNYRMLMDSLQSDGALKNAYQAGFPDANFQEAFQADYRAWITQVGHGRAQGMDPAHRTFFRDHIGPDCKGVLAPANLRNLGPQTRQAVRRRLEKQVNISSGDANLRRRLAVLLWQEGELDAAFKQMALAARLAPKAGEVIFSLGLLLRALGQKQRAVEVFRACAGRVPDSIWGVYADDAAAGRLFED